MLPLIEGADKGSVRRRGHAREAATPLTLTGFNLCSSVISVFTLFCTDGADKHRPLFNNRVHRRLTSFCKRLSNPARLYGAADAVQRECDRWVVLCNPAAGKSQRHDW